jgi:hypothetical protein
MENAIISLICITLILVGSVSITTSSIGAVAMLSDSWKQMTSHTLEMERTQIDAVSASTVDDGGTVELVVKNEGNTSLSDFGRWDVIVRSQDGGAVWLPYGLSTPGWSVTGIEWNGEPEVFQPNILDREEEAHLTLRLSSALAPGSTNVAVISTGNGSTTRAAFIN